MKSMSLFLAFFSLTVELQAASFIQLSCKKPVLEQSFSEKLKGLFSSAVEPKFEKIVIAEGLVQGSTKSSSKNGLPPSVLYFDLVSGKFVSATARAENLIELKYFSQGQLSIPDCKGSIIEVETTGFVD